MLVGLAASQSRAGVVGLMAALALAFSLGRRRGETIVSGWVVAAIVLAAALVVSRLDPVSLAGRVGGAGTAMSGRVAVWRSIMPVLRDFWMTGTGAGTFETIMLVYQRGPSLFRINAAHNHYLQVLIEGGVIIAVPVLVAGVLFVRAAAAALRRDRSGIYLIRAGALGGLAGAAVQSLFETGWLTPANALLAAVLAALVIHRPAHQAERAG